MNKRRYLQFRLKHLFLLTFVVAVACSIAAHRIAAMKSFDAIMNRDHGYAIVDSQPDWSHRFGIGELTDSPYLVVLDDDGTGEIVRLPLEEVGIPLDDEPLSDIELFFLVQHPQRSKKELRTCCANDSTIAELASCGCGAKILFLNCTRTTDRAFESLRDFPDLHEVMIGKSTVITDQGLRSLASCDRLSAIRIEGGHLTIDGLRPLCRLPLLKLVTANKVVGTPEELAALKAAAPGVRFVVELAGAPRDESLSREMWRIRLGDRSP